MLARGRGSPTSTELRVCSSETPEGLGEVPSGLHRGNSTAIQPAMRFSRGHHVQTYQVSRAIPSFESNAFPFAQTLPAMLWGKTE